MAANPVAAEKVAGGHGHCVAAAVLAGQKTPGGHSAGAVTPAPHQNPGGQRLQAASPATSAYEPAAQGVGAAAPAAEAVPGGASAWQGVVAPPVEKQPASVKPVGPADAVDAQ